MVLIVLLSESTNFLSSVTIIVAGNGRPHKPKKKIFDIMNILCFSLLHKDSYAIFLTEKNISNE